MRPAVVVPTFNHGRTVRGVLDAVAARHPDLTVIVVDDGSTDGTALGDWADDECRVLVTHPVNRGKAAALRAGFVELEGRGFTHAVTIDADGQHDAADVAALLDAAASSPKALVLGERADAIPGCPRRSLWGRRASNLLVRVESGLNVRDSQCGLRVYPLDETRRIGGRAGRYGYETAVLTRFAWAGLPVVRVPVGCVYDVPGGRVSHFRPLRDSLAAVVMHVGLLHRALLPTRRLGEEPTGTIFRRLLAWLDPRPAWRRARSDAADAKRFAAAFGVGTFVALLPITGIKTYACLAVARLLRLEPVPMLASSSIVSAPPVGPMLAVASIALGGVLVRGEVPQWGRYDPRERGVLSILGDVAIEWTVGGVLIGTVLGGLTYALAWWALTRRSPLAAGLAPRVRPQTRGASPAANADPAEAPAA